MIGNKMGRRKRKNIKIIRRKLPKVFGCPDCGMFSIRVLINKEIESKIVCGSCGLTWKKENTTKNPEVIDIYNKFIDEFVLARG
jgi:transcription elongation factor Elf1|tara:strand:+ start:3297 stop:3548 length:252 start_codon:yes stop_codon:yes gene_type:complete